MRKSRINLSADELRLLERLQAELGAGQHSIFNYEKAIQSVDPAFEQTMHEALYVKVVDLEKILKGLYSINNDPSSRRIIRIIGAATGCDDNCITS